MATKQKKKRRVELLLGIGAVVLVLAVLVLLAVNLPMWKLQNREEEPGTTAAPTVLEKNPYGPEDFGYEGDYLSCLSGESVLGIDVSSHQGSIDWRQVRDAGVEFVMIRVGYRGYLDGIIYPDERAQENYMGAKAAGLRVGAYFFSQATTVEESREEASFLLEAISGWELDMPVVFDWEYVSGEARTAGADARTVTDCTLTFCGMLEAAGYTPMVYFNVYQSRDLLYLEEVAQYDFWLAMYTDQMDYPYRVDMWQYTCTGTVPGIQGDVDVNLLLPSE